MTTAVGTLESMTKNMLTLLDSVLASTARTTRAALLIIVIAVATGTTPNLDTVIPHRSAVSVPAHGADAQGSR